MAEEAMESYLYAAYHPYAYRYPPPKGKGGAAGGWRPRGSGYFSGYGDPATAAEYFDNYQRAQLRAILSQVNPNLTPRLRKANTKEVGVQVNPRQDASVQCSLGPRTLLRRRSPGPSAAPRPREAPEQEQGSPATTSTRAVRFPRTIAVYSPMASRRLTAFLEEPGAEPERRPQQEEAAAVAVEEEPAAVREQREAEAAAVRASWEQPPERPTEPLGQRPTATPEPPATGPQESREEEEAVVAEAVPAAQAEPPDPPAAPQKREPAAGKTRLRFQVRGGREGAGPGRHPPRRVTLVLSSSWSRSTATTTARTATSAGRVPTSGASKAPTRSISGSSAEPARSPTTRTAWRTSPARAASRRGAAAR
ncbi:zygote arrest protein 1 isoform X1 [Heliangelus exortis]|uniref:zygote arrest protein 1 isoform X1 n=1 Tax=Heliangelus exortis TaxID=472823 RepID=UPI003A8E9AE4